MRIRNRQFIYRLFRRSSSEALPTQQNQTMIRKDGLQTAAKERQRQSKEFRTEAARQSIPKRWTMKDGCNLEKEEKLDWSYTQRRKPSEGGDRGSDDRKKTKGKETIGYAERVSERIVVCGTKEKGRKHERVENMEAKNLHHSRTLTTACRKKTRCSKAAS